MKLIVLLFLFGLYSVLIYSQQLELVSTAGDFFIYSNYNVAWSIGEPVTDAVNIDGSTISQGY
jgi:hypothetical protein